MNSNGFIGLMRESMAPFIHSTFPEGHRLIMDNDPKHKSKETTVWLKANDINHWLTPPQCPDLNPIELVWHELKVKVAESKPQSKIDFIKKIGKFWQETLTIEKCNQYINHLSKVLPHVVLNEGRATQF